MNNLYQRLGPYIQPPNAPITLWAVANLVALAVPRSWVGELAQIVATAALTYWAFMELVAGAGPFRRALGAVVLAVLLSSLMMALSAWR